MGLSVIVPALDEAEFIAATVVMAAPLADRDVVATTGPSPADERRGGAGAR